MEHLVSTYLGKLIIPISKKYCEKLIASHPDYPSFLSIADTLQRLGINHRVARIGKDHLDQLPFPCLIQPEGESKNGELKFIKDEDDLSALDTEFSSAVVLQAQPTDTVADPENEKQHSGETFQRVMTGILLTALAGLLLLANITAMPWMYGLLLLTALGGTATGYLLIAKDLGITYEQVEAFCNAGQKTNCDRILSSEEAKIFGGITLSDAAAGYFLFQTLMVGLFIPLSGGIASYYGVLALLSLVAIPVVVYSFYYQLVKAGTWCRLCLLVDGILIVQAALFGYMYIEGIISLGAISALPVSLTLFLFVAIGSGLVLVKNILKKAGKSERKEVIANRIKYNPDVFTGLLFQQDRMDTTPFEQELLIGDPQAPVRILMAASLGCGPCKKGFEKATQLVATYPDKVHLALRFRDSGSGENGVSSASTYLIEYWRRYIHGKADRSDRGEKLIRDWYGEPNIKSFKQRYPMKENHSLNGAADLAEQHYTWIEQTGINATPTFLINDYKLPRQYRIEDLMGMIPSLAEEFIHESPQQNVVATNKEIVPASERNNQG